MFRQRVIQYDPMPSDALWIPLAQFKFGFVAAEAPLEAVKSTLLEATSVDSAPRKRCGKLGRQG